MVDLASLANPAKDKEYGDDGALQYGVSVGAEAAGAGAAHHFFSADTRIVFGVNALEIGLVELYDMGLQRWVWLWVRVCVRACVSSHLVPAHHACKVRYAFGLREYEPGSQV